MALSALNALSAEDIKRVINTPLPKSYHTGLFDLMSEPYPHYVHYYGTKPSYVSPEYFHFRSHIGETDCVWIVPGTAG